MDLMTKYEELVEIAIVEVRRAYPILRRVEFSIDNITACDKERLLWYLIENYEEIEKDEKLIQMVMLSAYQKGNRKMQLNKFLCRYFQGIISYADWGGELKVDYVTEEDTEEMLNYLISKFDFLYNDEDLLRGIALFARTEPKHWWDEACSE